MVNEVWDAFYKKYQKKFKKMLEMHKLPIDKMKFLWYNKGAKRRTQVASAYERLLYI